MELWKESIIDSIERMISQIKITRANGGAVPLFIADHQIAMNRYQWVRDNIIPQMNGFNIPKNNFMYLDTDDNPQQYRINIVN